MAWPRRPKMPDSTSYRQPEAEVLFDEAARIGAMEVPEVARLWKRYESTGKLSDVELEDLEQAIAEAPVRCPDCGVEAPPGTHPDDSISPRCRYLNSPEANIPPRGAL